MTGQSSRRCDPRDGVLAAGEIMPPTSSHSCWGLRRVEAAATLSLQAICSTRTDKAGGGALHGLQSAHKVACPRASDDASERRRSLREKEDTALSVDPNPLTDGMLASSWYSCDASFSTTDVSEGPVFPNGSVNNVKVVPRPTRRTDGFRV